MADEAQFDREELLRRLSPHQCRYICQLSADPCVELWETGWGEPFALSPERCSAIRRGADQRDAAREFIGDSAAIRARLSDATGV
jgi:hypothetical protein